jgi:hypothetical protein
MTKDCEICGKEFEVVMGPGYANRITCYECTHGCPSRKATYRNKHLKRKYGMTQFQYKQMFDAQAGRCSICETELNFLNGTPTKGVKRLPNDCCIDHCHANGNVRGLLCFHCNTALGHMFDDLNRIDKMKEYLLKANNDNNLN